MNKIFFDAFRAELEKISTAQYVIGRDRLAPRIVAPRSRQGNRTLTVANFPKAIEEQLSKRAPRYAKEYATIAREMEDQIRAAGGDPSNVRIKMRPGLVPTPGGSRWPRRKGEARLDRNVSPKSERALPRYLSSPYDRVNQARFIDEKTKREIFPDPPTEGKPFTFNVDVSSGNPLVLAHEKGHVAQYFKGGKGGKSFPDPDELLGGQIGQEVDATQRALRTTYAKSNPADRAKMLAATGTYMENQPLFAMSTSDAPGFTAQLGTRRAALRNPYFKRSLQRHKKYLDLGDKLQARIDDLRDRQDKLPPSEKRNRWKPGPYKELQEKIDKLEKRYNRVYEGQERNLVRVRDANPFVDAGLYASMTPREKRYIDADIKSYAENIERHFGAEDAALYRREVRKALQSPTGRGIRDFLRRIKR